MCMYQIILFMNIVNEKQLEFRHGLIWARLAQPVAIDKPYY